MLSSFSAGSASSSRPPPLPVQLDIAIHQYRLDSFQPLHKVTIVGDPAWHQLIPFKPRVPKPPAVLPFGLAMPKRKRKARKPADRTTSGRAVRSRICDLSAHAVQAELQLLDSTQGAVKSSPSTPEQQLLLSSESAAEEESSECECDGSDASSPDLSDQSSVQESVSDGESCWVAVPDIDGAIPQDEEVPWKPCEQELVEECFQQECQRVATAVPEAEAPAKTEMATEAAVTPQPQPSQITGSFCNKSLGITDVGIQVSARLAKCRHCLVQIPRGAPRCAYAFSKVKFASWLHSTCVAKHLYQEGADFCQARTFLEECIRKESQLPEVKKAVKDILADLSLMDKT